MWDLRPSPCIVSAMPTMRLFQADRLTIKTDDEETGDYVGEVVAKVEPQEVEEQEAKQQKAKEQRIEQQKTKEQTKQPYSKPATQRKPRTNLSLLKPIPAFPGYK